MTQRTTLKEDGFVKLFVLNDEYTTQSNKFSIFVCFINLNTFTKRKSVERDKFRFCYVNGGRRFEFYV